MSKIRFTEEQIKEISENKNVKRISELSITYEDEFKLRFMEEYLNGKSARKIFKENGFNIEDLGSKRIEQCTARWRKDYEQDGILGLKDNRKINSGRKRNRELSSEEIISKQEARIRLLEEEVNILKKLDKSERRLVRGSKGLREQEIFELIHSTVNKNNYKGLTKYFCGLLGVSKSGYYRHLNTIETRNIRENKDIEDSRVILKAFNKRGYKKGSRGIKMVLENDFGVIYSRKKIQRVMRKFDIKCPYRKANPYRRMAKATKEHCVVSNTLKRKFKQEEPGKVCLTDITYIKFGGDKTAYLSVVKDGSTNEILAYHVSNKITLDIATSTIEKLISNKKVILKPDAFIHSDQGFHYTSPKFQQLLKFNGLSQSMSRRGNCWDNAPIESFFGHFKDEVDLKSCTTLNQLKHKINHYMHYYNNYRFQWNLKKMTPVQYRNHLLSF